MMWTIRMRRVRKLSVAARDASAPDASSPDAFDPASARVYPRERAARFKPMPMRERKADILIVGGGTGGIAAAMAAASLGRRVIVTEETSWIGGRLLAIISEMRINVIDVRHQRISSRLPIMQREETLTLETRDRAQCEQLLQRVRAAGYVVEEAQALE